MRTLALSSLAILVAACGSDPASGSDAGSGMDAAFPPGTDAAIAPGTDAALLPGIDAGIAASDAATPIADAGPPVRTCRSSCIAAADCVPAGGLALYAADDYACESGACRWLGCDDDAECRAAFGRTDYACRDESGLRQCLETCGASSECGSGTAAFDADNYSCTGGICRYTGCNDDAECAATFADARYVCRRVAPVTAGLPIPSAERNCVLGCSTASDCGQPSAAFDGDNYACVEGACVYTGCNDDAECRASLMASGYVCR